jgi:hypothetical protein
MVVEHYMVEEEVRGDEGNKERVRGKEKEKG